MYIAARHNTLALVFLFMLSTGSRAGQRQFTPGRPDARFSLVRTVRYSFTVKNKRNRMNPSGTLRAFAPLPETASQRCIRIKTSTAAALETDGLGNQVLVFLLGDLPPFGVRIIRIEATVLFAPDGPSPGPVGRDKAAFLQTELLIESNHPRIRRIAKQLQGDRTAPDAARQMFDWVVRHIRTTGYSARETSALTALDSGQGDCSEMALLFVALCRSADIPARYVSGWRMTGNSVLDPHGFHNWAEFYDGKRWRVADCSAGMFSRGKNTFLAVRTGTRAASRKFGEFYRFSIEGAGLEATMNHE